MPHQFQITKRHQFCFTVKCRTFFTSRHEHVRDKFICFQGECVHSTAVVMRIINHHSVVKSRENVVAATGGVGQSLEVVCPSGGRHWVVVRIYKNRRGGVGVIATSLRANLQDCVR